VEIRPARLDEAVQVSALLERVWRSTFEPLIGPARVAARHAEWHAPDVLARQIAAERASFLVADADPEGIVAHAFAAMRPDGTLVIFRLYVRETHQRQGLGTRLIDALISRHRGAKRVQLTVMTGTPAVAFYRRRGFATFGEVVEADGTSLRMERALV
jgi:ribosomal protein S18 acetylase RimI-like enzyme